MHTGNTWLETTSGLAIIKNCPHHIIIRKVQADTESLCSTDRKSAIHGQIEMCSLQMDPETVNVTTDRFREIMSTFVSV